MNHHRLAKKAFALILMVVMILSAMPALAVTVTPNLSYRFYMVGNSHIDTAWRWPIQHTAEEIIPDTFGRQVNALKGSSTYKFTASCSTHYKWTKEYYPALYEDIKDLFEKGQWGIAGGQFVEPDLNVMEGETFARHGLYAQHFFLEELGQIAYVGLVPDVFGFSGQFPQFLRKTGMTSYVATKMNWSSDPADGAMDPGPWSQSGSGQNAKGRESDIFWWEALDGSDVLAYNCYNDYTSSYSTSDFRTSSNNVFNRISRSGSVSLSGQPGYTNGTYYYDYDSNIKYALGMFGEGDHGGGPNSGTGSGNHGWPANNSGGTNGSVVLPATLEDYFRDVRKPGVGTNNNADGANRDATKLLNDGTSLGLVYRHAGENYLSYHRGTYTSWSRVKKYNRQLNNLSQTAEQAATIGFWTNSLANNSHEKIETSWERICINTMHDILPGSSGPIEYYQTFMNGELCKNLLTNVQNNALAALAYRADTTVSEGVPIFVYNPSSWQRDGETETTIQLDKGYPYIKVLDAANNEMPVTVIENRPDGAAKISFIAKAVPSLGYKVFKAVGSDVASSLSTDVQLVSNDASSIVIENDSLKFTISKTTGNIPSLINKKDNNREVFYQTAAFEGNALQWKTDTGGSSFPAWDMTSGEFGGVAQTFNTVTTLVGTPEIVVNTPEKITVKVTHRWTDSSSYGPSTATRYITLLAGSDKIDVHFELDWQMQQRNLKVAFPVAVDARAASYEIAYGALDGATEVARMDAAAALIAPGNANNPLMSNSLTGVPSYAGALGRATIRDTRWNAARFEQSGHKWMDVSADSKSHGMSILNDAKYGHDVLRMVRSGSSTAGTGTDAGIVGSETYVRARLTVVRSPQSANNDYQRATQVPNPTSHRIDIGEQNFNYSIYPHAGTWQDGSTSVKAHELNFPMQSFQTLPSAGDSILGKEKSFLSLNKSNVIVGAVKNQHDEPTNKNKLIVRVWETNGVDTTGVVMTLPSNVVAVREVNMLEHDYNELSNDNIDNPVSKALVAQNIARSGNTVTFNIGHYEILTMEIVIDPYAGAQLGLTQTQINLAGSFDTRGTSPDSARSVGNLDGSGNSIPEPLWNEARLSGVDYQGIKFQLGPDAANNFVAANGQTIPMSAGATGFTRVYLLGLAGKNASAVGKYTVNYSDGETVTKTIAFADWTSPLTGWVPMDRMDTNPYVYDSIAHVFTHWHTPSIDMMTMDNYLYVYYIDVDPAKTISSILLPEAVGAKIAAITLINSEAPEFGSTDEGKNGGDTEFYWQFSDLSVGYDVGTVIEKLNIAGAVSPLAQRAFSSLNSAGTSTSGTEGANQIVTNNGSSKWCNTSTNANNAWFIMDAGAARKDPGYVIRGANDDMSYTSRVLHSWIIQGGASASGPWTTISTENNRGSGWTANYQTRMFMFDWSNPDIPAAGYRYYRLQIIRIGNSANGTALGTSNTTVQFSYFGLVTAYGEDGELTTQALSGAIRQGDVITVNTVNGTNIIKLGGNVASTAVAPVSAKNYTSIKKGLNVKVTENTKLAYSFKPTDAISTHMSIDVKFLDGGYLRALNAVDQYGIALNPKAQGEGGKLKVGEWNYIETDLGKVAEGRVVSEIVFGFEVEDAQPGQAIEGLLDNVAIFVDKGESEDVKLYAALYTSTGKMVDYVISETVSPGAFSSILLDLMLTLDASKAGNGCYVKVFRWTPDDFIPVADEIRFQF